MSFPGGLKRSGLATGTKLNLLLAFLAHGAGHHSSLGRLGTSARSSKDRTSRTRPTPTIRAAAALQPRLCLYIGTYWHILHLVFVHPLLLLMLVCLFLLHDTRFIPLSVHNRRTLAPCFFCVSTILLWTQAKISSLGCHLTRNKSLFFNFHGTESGHALRLITILNTRIIFWNFPYILSS